MTDMERRDFIKLAGLGAGVTAVGLVVPLGESATTADWISTSSKPARFVRRLMSRRCSSRGWDEDGKYLLYEIEERRGRPSPRPGCAHHPGPGYALGGGPRPPFPGPLIRVDQNTRVRMRGPQRAPDHAPDLRLRASHLGAPPRLGLAAAVRRLRRRRRRCPARVQGLLVPEPPGTPGRSGTTTTASTTRPRTSTAASTRSTTSQNPWEKANLPAGQVRRPADDRRRDVRQGRHRWPTWTGSDSGLWGDVIMVNGVPWPFHDVERRFYRFRILDGDARRGR